MTPTATPTRMPTSAHIRFYQVQCQPLPIFDANFCPNPIYVDGDRATGNDLDHDGDGAAYDNIDDDCDGLPGDEVDVDGDGAKLSSPLMHRRLCRRRNGVVALVVMASLPSPMHRHLAVVDDDGDGARGNEVNNNGGGAKLSSPSMRRCLCLRSDGVAALIVMASLPSPMRRRLAVVPDDSDKVNNDGDSAKGDSVEDDGKGATYDDIDDDCDGATGDEVHNNDNCDGATGDKFDDDGDSATGNEVDDEDDDATGYDVDDNDDGRRRLRRRRQ